MTKKSITVLFVIIVFSFILNCGVQDQLEYLLTVDGYKDNFTGYYKIDGKYVENFSGKEAHVDDKGNAHYYFDKELDDFNSIKVYTFKDSGKCSLTVAIWKDDREVKSITSGENDGYDEDSDTYTLSLEPLYYEAEKDSEEESE